MILIVILTVLLVISVALNVVAGHFLLRGARRLLQFDDLIGMLADDLNTNIKYFEKLKTTPLISDAPEVQAVHRSMMMMADRFDEFVKRMEEMTGQELFKRTEKKSFPRPKVV